MALQRTGSLGLEAVRQLGARGRSVVSTAAQQAHGAGSDGAAMAGMVADPSATQREAGEAEEQADTQAAGVTGAGEAGAAASPEAEAAARGPPPPSIAVLYRTAAQSGAVEQHLVRAGVAYRVHAGSAFLDRKEVKDALSYLMLLANPRDATAFARCVQTPPRQVGAKTVEKLLAEAQAAGVPVLHRVLQQKGACACAFAC